MQSARHGGPSRRPPASAADGCKSSPPMHVGAAKSSSGAQKGLGQVCKEVIGMFDADRKPDRGVADADTGAQLGGYTRVRCGPRMAGERLRSAQADGKLEDLHPIEASERVRQPALNIEGKGRA